METASLYTVAQYCNLTHMTIIGISDSIASLSWEFYNNVNQINENLYNVIKIILEYINNE